MNDVQKQGCLFLQYLEAITNASSSALKHTIQTEVSHETAY